MKVSFGECVIEGIEEFFKHFVEYLVIAGIGYGIVKSFNPILNIILDQSTYAIFEIYLYFFGVFLVASILIYYLVQRVGINFIMQIEEERKDRKILRKMKNKLYKQIATKNMGKHLVNMFVLVILIFIIVLSRELCIAFVKVYGLSDHFLVELFLNLIFGSIGIRLFFVYVIGPLKVKNDKWTFNIARQFSVKMFAMTLQFFVVIILTTFLVGLVFNYFSNQDTYIMILGNKVNSLMVEIPVMILLSSVLVLYMIIHVIYTININKVHFKDKQWLIDTEFEYTNKW